MAKRCVWSRSNGTDAQPPHQYEDHQGVSASFVPLSLRDRADEVIE